MNRRQFWPAAGGVLLTTGGLAYLATKPPQATRPPVPPAGAVPLLPDEREILRLAALAPSGHNTQPWRVTRHAPFQWTIGNDCTRWLPAVDPAQRETMLSMGAFMQNLESAANYLGYACRWQLLADNNQAASMVDVKLAKAAGLPAVDVTGLLRRRTLRTGYRDQPLAPADVRALTAGEPGYHFFRRASPQGQWLDAQTLAANRQQTYRDAAEQELSRWVRFSNQEAARHRDGLTPASMGIGGVAGWWVRHFYSPATVMKTSFREQSMAQVAEQVGQSGGWLVLTSPDRATPTLLDAGRRVQRLWTQVRGCGIAVHPMTQVLEEAPFAQQVNGALGLAEPIQFLLRCGYVNDYPEPVAERRPVEWFVQNGAVGRNMA
ncbi:nitroreductase family protein [Hymenobacter sp. H14-R3]|uniref:Acg family FMN-binding oxidoreductase n=1 Tax=Hymenobacter sp. H14-R3 TaxID=3046308 RepID=UPI0024BB65B0|nr:nitroreductase family protein [Hymenobacter sp. H14-R3]MDJ0366720.1 nitroreductase family protein [Hymenobacter sp. H14-R3]